MKELKLFWKVSLYKLYVCVCVYKTNSNIIQKGFYYLGSSLVLQPHTPSQNSHFYIQDQFLGDTHTIYLGLFLELSSAYSRYSSLANTHWYKITTCLVKHPKHTPLNTLLHCADRQVVAPTDDTRQPESCIFLSKLIICVVTYVDHRCY